MADPITYFNRVAPTYMVKLMQDFGFDKLDAAAVFGNLGHESNGLTVYHEVGQPDEKGGVGWAQWTADRRRAFEAYCERNNYNPRSDETNYKYLFVELTETSEKAVIPKLKAANGLEAKTKTFCDVFERPGVKAYDSRLKWAQRAVEAFDALDGTQDTPPPNPIIASLIEQIKAATGVQKVSIVLE